MLNVKKEKIMATQIYRSGSSIGANISESRYAQSGPDFINKLSIALMLSDNTELTKMLISSIKTMKRKLGRE